MLNKHSLLILNLLAGIILSQAVLGDKNMDTMQILNNYYKSLSVFNLISTKIDIDEKWTPTREDETGHRHLSYAYRCNGNKYQWVGKDLSLGKDGSPLQPGSVEMQLIFTDDLRYYVHSGAFREPGNNQDIYVVASKNDCENLNGFLDDPEHGSFLWGRVYGNSHNSAYDLLRNSNNLKKLDIFDKINGIDCIVLEGITPYGQVKVWLAPQKAFTALQWIITKKNSDLFDNKSVETEKWIATFTAKDLQQIGDNYIVSSGVFSEMTEVKGKTSVTYHNFKLTNIELNPNFDSLGAFKLDVPNGTRVFIKEAPGIKYEWVDGKTIAVVDKSFRKRSCRF